MLGWIFEKRYNQYVDVTKMLEDYRKENHVLSGKVRILEEQQEIMHNFLVEINKYLARFADKDK